MHIHKYQDGKQLNISNQNISILCIVLESLSNETIKIFDAVSLQVQNMNKAFVTHIKCLFKFKI